MTKKIVKHKRKINKTNLWAIIVSFAAIIGLIGLIGGIVLIATMLRNKPTMNVADFDQTESSVIYDSDGHEIANLGSVIRQNVEFEEIPNCVIDAFVAIEDSRFFEHGGFDIPRFTKAMLENLRTLSFGQGGSTFTMQLVKNTYFVDDNTGQEAARSGASGVKRKVQEIALALELEKVKAKQDIFESYLNKLNFGGANIRGIQKASQYYFGKDVSQCSLVEGALLAGVINAPNYYNPFYNLEEAQARTTEVLYQMRNHGYITKAEYELAKTVRIEDLLNDPYSSKGDGEGIPYQAYVDAVVSEVISMTGLDPYSTTMHIYTYMNKDIQKEMDNIQAGETDDYFSFPDEYFECASVCIKNSTGEVVGILGGRNYADGGQLLLNHATEQYKQPGSSIKPILDYALAFENLGWATDHVLTDRPMYYDSTNQFLVFNDSGTYVGDVTLSQALGQSINTCAIQTLQQILDTKKYEYVVNYTKSLGYDFNLDDFNVQYGIGGSTCEVSPLQHAAAYAAIMNYGVYHTPHTVERIEFTNGKSPIIPVYESTEVLSEAASFLTTELMRLNVDNYGGTYTIVKSDDYQVYAKTGTTDYGTSGAQYGIPSGATKDGWLVAATSEYTTATWVGYEKAVLGQQSYIKSDYYQSERPSGKIAHMILEAAYKYGDSTPRKLERPSGVTSITHVIGTWPYALFTDDMDSSLRTTGLIKSDSVRLKQLAQPTIEDMDASGFQISFDSSRGSLRIDWPKYPDENKLEEAEDVKDISLKSGKEVIVAAAGKCLFDYTKLYGPVRYQADVYVNGNLVEHVSVKEDSTGVEVDFEPGDKIKVEGYYGYEKGSFTSNKVSREESSELRITFPDKDSSFDKVENWCSKYSFCKLETTESTIQTGFTIRDSERSYNPGESITITDQGWSCLITYYVDTELKVTTRNTNGDSTLHIRASYGDNPGAIEWDYEEQSGVDMKLSDNTLVISVTDEEADFNFDVVIKANKQRVTKRVSVKDNKVTTN